VTKALVLLASGFEEIEASTIVDVLRRSGVDVVVAALVQGLVKGSHGMRFASDTTIDKVAAADFDAIVCPGGAPGYMNLRNDQKVLAMIQEAFKSNKLVAAICAAPAVLSDAGILRGKMCTIYPGMEGELEGGGGIVSKKTVVIDGNVLTSQGPATALAFALKLAEELAGEKTALEVGRRMLADEILERSTRSSDSTLHGHDVEN